MTVYSFHLVLDNQSKMEMDWQGISNYFGRTQPQLLVLSAKLNSFISAMNSIVGILDCITFHYFQWQSISAQLCNQPHTR